MFQVTEKAGDMIREIFQGRNDPLVIRIFLTEGPFSGPMLSLGLSETREDDEVFDQNGVTYCVNRQLFEEAKPVRVDFEEGILRAGFSIQSRLDLEGAGCGG